MGGTEGTNADAAMTRYSLGEEEAFDELYDALAPRLANLLRRHLRRTPQIEDVIQQTFLQMHQARGTFIAGAPVLPWAFAIARRLVIDQARRHHDREILDLGDEDKLSLAPLSAHTHSGEDMLAARETGARVNTAYQALTEPQRAAFELVATDGLSHAEAACVLGTTVTGIKLRIHRAYLSLREAVKEPDLVSSLAPATPRGHR
jgi:RNA polymerase sigma-70 factor (ECF subfamily)